MTTETRTDGKGIRSLLDLAEKEMETLRSYAEGKISEYQDVVGAGESIKFAIEFLDEENGRRLSNQYKGLRQQCDYIHGPEVEI